MLKIIDYNPDGTKFDLKELEKFGFKKLRMGDGYKFNRYYTGQDGNYIIVNDEEGFYYKVLHSADWSINNNLDLLYNLIKADLVEKVEE